MISDARSTDGRRTENSNVSVATPELAPVNDPADEARARRRAEAAEETNPKGAKQSVLPTIGNGPKSAAAATTSMADATTTTVTDNAADLSVATPELAPIGDPADAARATSQIRDEKEQKKHNEDGGALVLMEEGGTEADAPAPPSGFYAPTIPGAVSVPGTDQAGGGGSQHDSSTTQLQSSTLPTHSSNALLISATLVDGEEEEGHIDADMTSAAAERGPVFEASVLEKRFEWTMCLSDCRLLSLVCVVLVLVLGLAVGLSLRDDGEGSSAADAALAGGGNGRASVPVPTAIPTVMPSPNPSVSSNPSTSPSSIPSLSPSNNPTLRPTSTPSYAPTSTPSFHPTQSFSPTAAPTCAPCKRITITGIYPDDDGAGGDPEFWIWITPTGRSKAELGYYTRPPSRWSTEYIQHEVLTSLGSGSALVVDITEDDFGFVDPDDTYQRTIEANEWYRPSSCDPYTEEFCIQEGIGAGCGDFRIRILVEPDDC